MKPLLRIAAMGDIQGYPYPEDAGMRNLERALDVLVPLQPDVVVNVGDINDTGNDADAVRYYKARCDARLGSLPHIACLGNHATNAGPSAPRPPFCATSTPSSATRRTSGSFGVPSKASNSLPFRSLASLATPTRKSQNSGPRSTPPRHAIPRARCSPSRTTTPRTR